MTARSAITTAAVALLAVVGLSACESHEGEHCVDHYTTTTYIKSGNVLVPVTSTHCARWEKDA